MSKQSSATAGFVFSLTDKQGNITNYAAEQPMAESNIGSVLGNAVKTAGSFRLAALSFLRWVYSHPQLDTYRHGESNACNAADGKVSANFKAAVRKAEDAVIAHMVAEGTLKLPKGAKDNDAINNFAKELRADSNYSNAKNTTNKYVAFCAANVLDNGYVVPIEVQRARIKDALPVAEQDKSFAAMFRAIKEKMDGGTIDEDDAVDSLAIARELYQTLDAVVRGMAETATAARSGVDVAANAALEKAAASSKETATI